jgi:hypothetical protein
MSCRLTSTVDKGKFQRFSVKTNCFSGSALVHKIIIPELELFIPYHSADVTRTVYQQYGGTGHLSGKSRHILMQDVFFRLDFARFGLPVLSFILIRS